MIVVPHFLSQINSYFCCFQAESAQTISFLLHRFQIPQYFFRHKEEAIVYYKRKLHTLLQPA